MNRPLPSPERRRQRPPQFSWLDQRLARHNYFARTTSDAWLLYLFLVTVADADGVSFYSEPTLCQRLGWDQSRLRHNRQALLRLQLIAYAAPLYQVLALPAPRPARDPAPHLRRLRQQLQGEHR